MNSLHLLDADDTDSLCENADDDGFFYRFQPARFSKPCRFTWKLINGYVAK